MNWLLGAKIAGILAGLVVAAWFWNRDHAALSDARRDAEVARLELANQIVARQDEAKYLKANLQELLGQNQALKAAVEDAQHAAPGAKPIEITVLKTVEVPVQGPPREVVREVPRDVHVPVPVSGEGACVLAQGDKGSLTVNVVELRTREGNVVVTGTAEAWREDPGPRAKLLEGAFSSRLSRSEMEGQPAQPRWGVGLVAACGGSGGALACGLGPSVAFPALSAWGVRAELSAGLTLGSLTQGVILGAVRW